MSSPQLSELISSLDLECKTQVACRKTRGTLLTIKKLTDTLRKDYLAKSVELKKSAPKRIRKPPAVPVATINPEPMEQGLAAISPEQM